MYPRRFAVAYVMLGFAVLCAMTVLACAWLVGGRTTTVYAPTGPAPITNKMHPDDVEAHFATGQEYNQVPATAVGMRDGTCYVYTNEVAWLAMECFGAVRP